MKRKFYCGLFCAFATERKFCCEGIFLAGRWSVPCGGEGSPQPPAWRWTHRLTARSVIQRKEGKTIQKNVNPERGIELLEICFDTFCKNGLEGTSMKMLS